MQLKLFKTLWGFTEDVEVAIRQAIQADFQGLEGAVPANSGLVKRWKSQLGDAGLDFIAEITTAGSYVPDRNAGLQEHLDSLESKLEYSLMVDPLFITCLGGCDAWPEAKNVEFFSRAMELANAANCIISFETHRGRALFNPWITERIVAQLPEIKLIRNWKCYTGSLQMPGTFMLESAMTRGHRYRILLHRNIKTPCDLTRGGGS